MDLIEIEKMIAEATVKLEAENARLTAENVALRLEQKMRLMAEASNARLREELEVSRKWKDTYELGLEAAKIELACTKDILEQTRVELAASEKMRNVWQCAFEESRVELASAQLDAARYRWRLSYIKENINDNVAVRFALESTDAAIDNAMKEVGHEQV